jgi:hypothetical protein
VPATRKLSFSESFLGRSSEASAGMKVKDSTSAPASANSTVRAIGRNIFPSMPTSDRIGR